MSLLFFTVFGIVFLTSLLLLYVMLIQWSEACHKYVDQHIVTVGERSEMHNKILLDHDNRLNIIEALIRELLLLSKSDQKASKRLETVTLNDELCV
jgi:hypothetical protein